MRKILKKCVVCLLLATLVWCGTVIGDRLTLRKDLIRLHVVAASDSVEDQALKLRVRDAVTGYLEENMCLVSNTEEAETYIRENLPALRHVAQTVLRENGNQVQVPLGLTEEAFPVRHYDTFSLPAGVYQSLRIVIGDGEGQNWWCVVFPTLCLPETEEDFEAAAVDAGFEDALACALTGKEGYELRFYFLELLGRMENMLFKG